jgi:glycosyltransferase involved in cell wall biosynthesis
VPRVSIGLTVFNSERYLEECLQSLLAQTFEDFELIISDNASCDGTRAIALAYATRDDRVRYIRNRYNLGLAGNFNQAFRLSSGEFFKWAAYDDLCSHDFLLRCVEVLDRDPRVVLAYPRTEGIDEQGRVTVRHGPGPDLTSPDPATRFSRIMRAPFWGTPLFGLVRADVLRLTGLMPSNIAPDHVLLAELSLRGRFQLTPEDGLFNRDHPGRWYVKSSTFRRAQQVDPQLGKSAFLLRLRQFQSYLSAIGRVPLDEPSRLRCYLAVGRWVADRVAARALSRDRRVGRGT